MCIEVFGGAWMYTDCGIADTGFRVVSLLIDG
jgi:hypothetical protein